MGKDVNGRMKQKQSQKVISQNFANGKTCCVTVYKVSANPKHSAEETAINHRIVWLFKTKDKGKYYKNKGRNGEKRRDECPKLWNSNLNENIAPKLKENKYFRQVKAESVSITFRTI